MATKKRQLKKPVESVRERAAKAAEPKQPRRIHKVRSQTSKPFKAIAKVLKTIFAPFSFVLKPFKTKPLRAVGRFLATVLLLRYVRNSWRELRQVDWPNRRTTWQLTAAVFIFALFFGVIIALSDYGLDKVFKKLIIK